MHMYVHVHVYVGVSLRSVHVAFDVVASVILYVHVCGVLACGYGARARTRA